MYYILLLHPKLAMHYSVLYQGSSSYYVYDYYCYCDYVTHSYIHVHVYVGTMYLWLCISHKKERMLFILRIFCLSISVKKRPCFGFALSWYTKNMAHKMNKKKNRGSEGNNSIDFTISQFVTVLKYYNLILFSHNLIIGWSFHHQMQCL